MKLQTKSFIIEYDDTPEIHKKVFDVVLEYFKNHEAFHGETIMQSDDPIIDAPNVLAHIADDIMKFKVYEKENT